MNIRRARGADAPAIRDILMAAFNGDAEALLVERLRAESGLALELVADDRGVFGYIGFPRLRVDDAQGVFDVVGLAPVAVAPDHQRRGVGSALIREAHRLLAGEGHSLSFVLGDPAYYQRFGYDLAATKPFESVYAGPHFMALRLNDGAPERGKVRYPAAFDQLG